MAERIGVVHYCGLVKKEGEGLLKLMKDSSLGWIQCKGWDGTGRWRIAEYAAKRAMESHLFDVLIWVDLQTQEFTPRNVQMSIAQSLRIQPPRTNKYFNFTADLQTANQIYKNLTATNFLLVVGGSYKKLVEIDLAGLGIPDVVLSSGSFSKVVWVGELTKRISTYPLRLLKPKVDIKSGTASASEVWDWFFEEAALAAHSLRNLRFFSPNVVMDCIMYLALFVFDQFPLSEQKEWFVRFCIAEGIINGGEMETEEVLLEAMDQLLKELDHRSILEHDLFLSSNVQLQLQYILADTQHRFWMRRDSLPKEDDENHGWGSIQKMRLGDRNHLDNIIRNRFPQSPKAPNLTTLIIANMLMETLPSTFFLHMDGLRVLDLHSTSINSLPSSLSSLCNLRLLMLRDCDNIQSLPTSLRCLEKLEFLDLSGCSSLDMIPEKSFDLMGKLGLLDLSQTRIQSLPSSVSNLHNLRQLLLIGCRQLTEMPENCFQWMSHLQVLNLSSAISLKSLPSSLSNLISLKILDLSCCESLKTGVGLRSLQNLSSLEVLDLSFCYKLEDIMDVSFQHIPHKLRDVNISGTPMSKRILFRGYQSMERLRLGDLKCLAVLHLFGCTKLEELNLCSYSYNSLRHLDILPMENFDKVNVFGKDERYKVLYWGEDDVGARIWVSNPDFFKSILHVDKEILQSKCFSRFFIRISPYREEPEEEWCMPRSAMIKIQNIHLQRSRFVYKDIYNSQIHTPHLFPLLTVAYSKCLEIFQSDSSPKGLQNFLAHTELVILFNHSFVERLSDLCDAMKLEHLKECQIGSCQRLETLFLADNPNFDILRSLEVIRASDLPKLFTVSSGVYGIESFTCLKHIFLQHCPKLVTLFTSVVHLQSLETLQIRYCSRLENVFGEEVKGREGSLPTLLNLYLLHVPKLKRICNGSLPHLEKLHVHRCPMLRKLPIQVHLVDHGSQSLGSTSSSLSMVEIRGEQEWWKSLKWGSASENNNIVRLAHFRPWRHLPATMQKRH